jgi:hypothetical protein
VKPALLRLRDEVGTLALAGLVLLAASGVFLMAAVKPLEKRAQALEREVSGAARRLPTYGMTRVGGGTPEERLAAFYRYFERTEDPLEWLAKLNFMAKDQGLEARSADYRLEDTRQKLSRYQVTLPVTGGYAQIRAFLENALADCPAMSLDQLTLRRRNSNETRIDAEIVLTLHMLRK